MIPLGFLGQNNRTLSKEIWVSWGHLWAQDSKVYCNALDVGYSNINTQINLKNALGEDTPIYLIQGTDIDGMNMGFSLSNYTPSTLEIINRTQLYMYYDGAGVYSNLTFGSSTSSYNLDFYLLNGMFSGTIDIGVFNTGQSSVLYPNTLAPVQTTMDVSEDWIARPSLTLSPSSVIQVFPDNSGDGYSVIRAIVIKLL